MDAPDPRAALEALIKEHASDMASLSKMLGRNPAYIQQFIKRGTPKRLDEQDRAKLARFFGVSEQLLGGRAAEILPAAGGKIRHGLVSVRRLEIGASAGPGAFADDERAPRRVTFEAAWLRGLVGGDPGELSIIQVDGDSMSPTLSDGDEILVDHGDAAPRLRDGIYVMRMDDALLVKRLARNPATRRIDVRSDNPAYPGWPDCDPADIDIIGRVVWASRKIA